MSASSAARKPRADFVEDVVDHLRNCSRKDEVGLQLLEFFDNGIYDHIRASDPLYIALPFWSQNEESKSIDDAGDWAHLPCFVADRKITLAYAVFFAAFTDSNDDFSFSTWVARSRKRHIPSVIEFHRLPGRRWPKGSDVVRVTNAGRFAPDGSVLSLLIAAPYIEELEIGPPTTGTEKAVCKQFTRRRPRALDILDFSQLSLAKDAIRDVADSKLQQLKGVLRSAEFEQYHDSLRDALESTGARRRLAVDTRGLARFLTQYSLIPEWQHAYHIPSKTILETHPEATNRAPRRYQKGSGGPIIVSRGSLGAAVSSLSIATNLEYRVMSLNDWIRHGQSKVVEQALRTAVAAIMARNASHNTGSHGLAHLISDTLKANPSETKAFLAYIKARMDFVADVTTYWRTMPWLERSI